MHQGGTTTYLHILDESTYEWTTNEEDARSSAASYYRNSEGIVYHDGLLYFVAKETATLFILDLENMTYEKETTGSQFEGKGGFNAQPDQIVLGNYKEWIYFTEDGGDTPGVYVRSRDGTYRTIFEGISGAYVDDETVGVALSPDRRKLYAGVSVAVIRELSSISSSIVTNSHQCLYILCVYEKRFKTSDCSWNLLERMDCHSYDWPIVSMALGHVNNNDIGNMRSNLPLRFNSVVIDNWKNMYQHH